jgi:RNA polymerase sigma-32 factor
MNRRLGGDASLNAPIREEHESSEWQDWLVDEAPSQERLLLENEELDTRRQALGEALTVLDKRERRIFEARHLTEERMTLNELAGEFGVSRERVRQIEVRAFEKVERAVRHRVAALDRGSETRNKNRLRRSALRKANSIDQPCRTRQCLPNQRSPCLLRPS